MAAPTLFTKHPEPQRFTPRYYQQDAVDAGIAFFNEPKNKLGNGILVLPTGSGKSLIIALIIQGLVGKTIVLQPSKEILEQNFDKLQSYGYTAGIYSASLNKKEVRKITFATIGSVVNNSHLFQDFQHIIVDECDLCNPNGGQYKDFFDSLEKTKVLGLTATPYRLSSNSYGSELRFITRTQKRVFKRVLYHINPRPLFAAGYLAKLKYFDMPGFDRSKLIMKSNGSGYTDESVERQYNDSNIQPRLIKIIMRLVEKGEKHILVFTQLVKESIYLSRLFDHASYICSDTKLVSAAQRVDRIKRFKSGDIKIMFNVGVLACLSEETEVLSKIGWLKKDNISMDDLIAQYDNGVISFEKPIHKHEHLHYGEMVSVDSRYVTFDVTDDHDMLTKHKTDLIFKKKKAKSIVGKRIVIPVSGFCEPEMLVIEQNYLIKRGRFLAQNSYNYRKKGASKIEADILALESWNTKSNLKYKNPNELTIDECRLIGFWLGDGSVSKSSGGINAYTLSQSFRTPAMLKWIEKTLNLCNIEYNFKDLPGGESIIMGNKCYTSGHRVYQLNKGTGGNNQKKNGLYSLIPYLVKKGTEYFKGLNREQYFALMEGLFKADGWHGNNKEYSGGKIVGEYKELFDLLQEIGVCRGYRVTIKPVKMRKNNKKQLYNISLFDKTNHQLTNEKAISTPANGVPVWCLTMPKGTLVTRNKGTVTIMGNCGFDFPACANCVIARPTMSLRSYYQWVGRIMRPHPSKEYGMVIDLCGNIQQFGAIEDLTMEFDDGGKWVITSRGRQLTNITFGEGKPAYLP